MRNSTKLLLGALLGTALVAPGMASADPDVRARVRIGPAGRPHVAVHVDRFHRVPPDIRAHGFPGHVAVRVNPFRAHLGWRVNRFTPRERAMWTHGRWWHGRHSGRLGWWWWTNGGWYFYAAPVYPYPDYVSQTYYDEPSADTGDYWYYCRDPEGYYPYVRTCHGSWQPVAAQPDSNESGYDRGGYGPGRGGYGLGRGGYGPGGGGAGPSGSYGPNDQGPPSGYGPNDQGPPDGYGQDDQGPPDGYGQDDQGPPDGYGPDDQGPPDGYGPDDQGPPDEGPPPR